MNRQARTTGSKRSPAVWLSAFTLCSMACGSDAHPAADGGSAGAGRSGNAAVSGGVTGSAGKTPAPGGTSGAAGKTPGSAGLTGSAGKTAGSGGAAGTAAVSGEDAGTPPCAPCIESSVNWGNIGGLVAFSERSTLDACNVYQHTRTPAGRGTATMLACERALPCMGSGLHGVSDVLQALQNADVQAALAKGEVLFGSDPRPVDGTVFEVVARTGSSIQVGGVCQSGGSCPAIPAGILALADLLRAIDSEQLSLDPCRSMFQP